MARVTNEDILHEVAQQKAELAAIRGELQKLNGTVKSQGTDIALLKQERTFRDQEWGGGVAFREHGRDIALLQQRQTQHDVSWSQVTNIVLAVIQSLAIAWVLGNR